MFYENEKLQQQQLHQFLPNAFVVQLKYMVHKICVCASVRACVCEYVPQCVRVRVCVFA